MNANNVNQPRKEEIAGDSTPAKLIVVTGDVTDSLLDMLQSTGLRKHSGGNAWQTAQPNLSGTSGGQAQVRVELDLERASDALQQSDSAHVIVFYEGPQKRLAAAIASNEPLEAAIQDGKRHTERILRSYRANRRRVTLIDSHAALSNPGQALETIKQRTSIHLVPDALGKSIGSVASAAAPKESTDFLTETIAECALAEDYDFKLLAKELAAGSAMQSRHAESSLAQRLLVLRDSIDTEAKEAQNKDTENELLILQLHQIQDELELYFNKSKELENALESSRLHAKTVESDLKTAKQQNVRQNSEINDQGRQHVKLAKEIDALNAQLELAGKSLTSRKGTINQMKQSLSWKVTAPLRWLLGLFVSSKN